ncbi:MAG: type II toxin-antitoxin system YhaV family toxin [Nostoc sp. NMS4]|nr:type II toxin-antitoxin system YhaV family toxin [Nostoc sp. NMS4]
MKVIAILWLGFPRKEGAKDDCYEVFTKMVARGTFPDSLDELIVE